MSKYGFALHTSTPELGLAIAPLTLAGHEQASQIRRHYRSNVWDLGRNTSNVLHTYMLEFITPQNWSDLAWMAIGIGPGGFTGTRLAAVTAKTIGQQLQIPVYGISNLVAVAWQQQIDGDVAVMMPAQQGQIYTAVYRISHINHTIEVLEADRLTTPENWQPYLDQFNGSKVILESGSKLGSTVDSVWKLASLQWQAGITSTWENLTPFYG
jgi:tRNA threonylcarbamoyl adenosine modification protein YeaZ